MLHGFLAHLVLTEAVFAADARPDIPPVMVNWHHDYFLEVTMLHSSEVPEEMKLTKVWLACKQSNHTDRVFQHLGLNVNATVVINMRCTGNAVRTSMPCAVSK